jgi:hypothetical protein
MKKNIMRMLFGLLLLCSLLLNAMFIYNGTAEMDLTRYKYHYCPSQMALIDSLKSECTELLPNGRDLD